jgi:PAS domain S-box-containing protein
VSSGDGPPISCLDESAEELYEDAPCGYLSTRADGTIVRANRTFLALAGYDADELVGRKRFYDLLPPGAKIYYETHYAPLLQIQGAVNEIALEIVRADGARVPVLVNAVVRASAAPEAPVVRITVLDASARRGYERELLRARADAEQRASAAAALQHVTEGVVLLDDDGRVVVVNPAAVRMLALPPAEAVGAAFSSLVPGWDAVAPRIPVGRAGADPVSAVLPLSVGDDARWIAASAQTAPDGVVYTLRDVTEERRLAHLRDDIVAIVSHELRTPLTGVLGAAQTLAARGSSLPDEQRDQLAAMIAEQSGRLARIVEEILFTQRLDTGEVALERESFDAAEVVRRICAGAAAWRTTRTIELEAEDGLRADGDPAMFQQVVVNLLDNAVKYGPDGEPVRVRVERHRSNARVVVSDLGPGVPPANREHVFQKFFRLDPAQSAGVPGTGLGLYIARELAHRMRGQVGLLPVPRGAAFFFDLPLATD